jgi:hypothetical protein
MTAEPLYSEFCRLLAASAPHQAADVFQPTDLCKGGRP